MEWLTINERMVGGLSYENQQYNGGYSEYELEEFSELDQDPFPKVVLLAYFWKHEMGTKDK